jgi:hypothetical protein
VGVRKYRTRANVSRDGSKSVRSTIPPFVADLLELKHGDSILWTVADLGKGKVVVSRERKRKTKPT